MSGLITPRLRRRVATALLSLKARVTAAVILLLLVAVGLGTASWITHAERATLANQNERELTEVARAANALSRHLVSLQRSLGVVATQIERRQLGRPAELVAQVLDKPLPRAMFSSLLVMNPQGEVLAFVDPDGHRPSRLNLGDRPYFKDTVEALRPVISEPVQSRVSGQPVILFTWPLIDADGLYGVVAASIRLDDRDLLSNLTDDPGTGTDTLLLVADARGRILAHTEHARTLQSVADQPRLAEAWQHWQASGSPAEPAGLRLQQAGEVVTTAGVAGPGWVVWRASPEAAILAPLREARREALTQATALVLVVSAATLLLMWRLLRPLVQLQTRAKRLFDNATDPQQGWPGGHGEIGELSRVLQQVSVERRALEDRNAAMLARLRSVMDAAPVGIAFSRERRLELLSAEFCRLLGRDESSLLGHSLLPLFADAAEHADFARAAQEAFDAGGAYAGEWRLLRGDGQGFWCSVRGRRADPAQPEAGAIWTLSDVDHQVAERRRLEWSASHDSLTGLANRKAFELHLAQVFDARASGPPAALVMIDLDHFKPINDRAGHAAGDAMLKAVALAINAHVRTGDLVARLGGDEFALLLERCPPQAALRIARTVRAAIADLRQPWQGHALRVGASVGVAALNAALNEADDWLAAADAACYQAKAEGRGRVVAAASAASLQAVGPLDGDDAPVLRTPVAQPGA